MEVNQVARYLVKCGKEVFIHPLEKADAASVHLFLAGSVFGALLHQQCLLPLHGSSFSYNGKGVVICGRSGVGKSSVVAALCQNGGTFINDDITPLQISDNQTTIIPIKTRLKLWDDSLEKLKIQNTNLERIRPMMEKFYLPADNSSVKEQRLNQLFILNTHEKDEYFISELTGLEKYNAIQNHIYRKIYLKGMPETNKIYFNQLLKLSKQITCKRVIRPRICNINDTMEFIRKVIC
jgi:GTPase SAR1 family protein